MEKSLTKAKGGLEAKVERLKSMVYQSSLIKVVVMFLTKEKIKTERLLERHHKIEDLSCLAHIRDESTFFASKSDEAKEKGERVT